MAKINVGHYEADGGIIYLPLGYVPDFIMLVDFHTNTNIIFYYWWERMEDDQATGKQEGISVAEGITANLADDAGITAYDTGSQIPTVQSWTQARATAATARSATAHGTYIRPTASSDMEQDAIFECVTAGTGGSTEPTWPKEIDGQVTDGTVVWEWVNVPLERGGYQGVCVQDDIQTDGQEMYYLAMLADKSVDHGDVDGWTGGVEGA